MWSHNLVKRQSLILFIVIAIDLLSFGILIPILPTLFRDVSSPIFIAQNISVNYIYIALGTFTAVYGFGQFFVNPILGGLSDRFGRRKTIIYAVTGTLIARVIMFIGIITQSFWIVIFSRFFDGATGGIISIAQASMADITNKENRAKYLGLLGAAFGVGFIFGPAIGALLSIFSFKYVEYMPFILGILFSGLALLILFFNFKETLDEETLLKNRQNKFAPIKDINKVLKNIVLVLKDKKYTKYFIVFGIYSLGFSMYTPYVGIYLRDYFGYSQFYIGVILTIAGVFISLTQGLLAYKIINKYGSRKSIITGLFIASLSISSLTSITFIWALPFVSTIFIAFGISLASVAITSSISKRAGDNQGTVLGVSSSLQTLAIGLAPLIGGFASYFDESLSITLSAIFILIAWFVFIFWRENKSILNI